MNQEALQKLKVRISEESCNSLRRVYPCQIKEWTGQEDAADLIGDLEKEGLLTRKYDFQCECGNQCTVSGGMLNESSFQCPECGRNYLREEILQKGTLLFALDKKKIMKMGENNMAKKMELQPGTKIKFENGVDKDKVFVILSELLPCARTEGCYKARFEDGEAYVFPSELKELGYTVLE